MKIIELRGENIKRMKAFSIKPDGNTVIVSGKNGQGKSSVLDSIVLALGGKSTDLAKLTTKPIRHGEKTAFVEVDLGEYTVKRAWTERKDFLEILGKDGIRFGSPQKMLDKLIGDLSFDPLEFSRLPAKQQRAILLEISDLSIDLDEWDLNYRDVFEKRTEIGREVKRLQGAADSLESGYSSDTPKEEVSVIDLSKKLNEVNANNVEIKRIIEDIKCAKVEEQKLKIRLSEIEAGIKKASEFLETNTIIDTEDLETQIENAERINKAVRGRKTFEQTENDLIEQQKKYEKGTVYLAKQDEEKANALKEAKMPIGGLGFDDEGITFKDIPFGQLCQSEQIKVSMAIAMAQNPKLRIIRINDGSLLDEDNLKAVQEMAGKNDFQIWIERVSSDGKTGVVIEDGEIVPQNDGEK